MTVTLFKKCHCFFLLRRKKSCTAQSMYSLKLSCSLTHSLTRSLTHSLFPHAHTHTHTSSLSSELYTIRHVNLETSSHVCNPPGGRVGLHPALPLLPAPGAGPGPATVTGPGSGPGSGFPPALHTIHNEEISFYFSC